MVYNKKMITKVYQYINELHMVKEGDHVVVGLSGGADSVCLLFLLNQLKDRLKISLEALHIHHGLRKESDEEEIFVTNMCKAWGILLRVEKVDVKALQEEKHIGTEEAARILRYELFESEIRNGAKVATAHHKNDQAETVLFHLFRGSSLRGLRGIQPIRDQYIRPLLCVTRNEIEKYLSEKEISYVIDQSNFDTVYARNLIRHELLPLAEDKICTQTVEHISTCSDDVEEALDYLDYEVQKLFNRYVEKTDQGYRIAKDTLEKQHSYMQSELVYRMCTICAGRKKDFSKKHITSVLALLSLQSGRKINLIYHVEAMVDQHYLYVFMNSENGKIAPIDNNEFAIKNTKSEMSELFLDLSVKTRIFTNEKGLDIPKGNYTKWFDYDKIKADFTLRKRKTGDYFYCTPTAKKKLQDYMVDIKIPLAERDDIPLIADGDHIMWVVGYRISEFYKITEETKQILEITIIQKENNQ